MAAFTTRLRTRQGQIDPEQGEKLKRMLADFPGLPERLRRSMIVAVNRCIPVEDGSTFMQLTSAQNAAVVDWLSEHSRHPKVAMRLWAILFTNMDRDTQEIFFTRDDLADLARTHPNNVSEIMRELVSIGAVIVRREPVPGLKGPGVNRYFMNPKVATQLSGLAKKLARADAPDIHLDVEPA